jgi:hypothetical protein
MVSSQRQKPEALLSGDSLIPWGLGAGGQSRSAHWEEKDLGNQGNESRLLSYAACSVASMLSELLH